VRGVHGHDLASLDYYYFSNLVVPTRKSRNCFYPVSGAVPCRHTNHFIIGQPKPVFVIQTARVPPDVTDMPVTFTGANLDYSAGVRKSENRALVSVNNFIRAVSVGFGCGQGYCPKCFKPVN